MRLKFQQELTDRRFAEVGRPYRLFRDPNNRFVAICSAFDLLNWPGRAFSVGQKLHHRISLYSTEAFERIAVLDLHFPINDIAFHPTECKVAVGTGSYDGGHFFEGELLLWDWKTGARHSLLGEWREVVRCRFSNLNAIVALLRPRNEQEYLDDEAEYQDVDPFEATIGVELTDLRPPAELGIMRSGMDSRLIDLQPDDPARWGFSQTVGCARLGIAEADAAELRRHGFEERHTIWDVLWLDDHTYAVAHQKCHLELWSLQNGRTARFLGEGHGVELLPHGDGGCLVHVIRRTDVCVQTPDHSSLLLLRGDALSTFCEFDHGCSFSCDSAGNILARATADYVRRERQRTDHVLNDVGITLVKRDLGFFDASNHSLRLNGGPALYFLRGTPATNYRNKVLCTVSPDGSVCEVMAWDEGEPHMMSSVCDFLPDQRIVRACEVYHPHSPGRTALVECLSLADTQSVWKTQMEGCFTALATLHGTAGVAFAQSNGNLGLIDSATGEILTCSPTIIDGIPTIITALAVRDDRLIAGTIDGRLLLYQVKP
jgi:hypothetical protein